MSDALAIYHQAERRERFRSYMKAFNPTAPAVEVITADLILEDLHQSLHKSLGARADLEPGSQQLVVGGIGSGKTTELLLTHRLLSFSRKTLPLYIDVTAETDLSELNSGALLASFGLRLATDILHRVSDSTFTKSEINDLKQKFQAIHHFAYGKAESKWVSYDDEPYYDDYDPSGHYVERRTEGTLKPFPPLRREIQEIQESLGTFISASKRFGLDVVVIFDGLDRLIQPDKFWAVVQQDLRVFRNLSVSTLITGPISVLYGAGRAIGDYFDRVHHLAAITLESERLGFLHSLLKKRDSTVLLGSDLVSRICYASGGVLRDLITLARDAGEEAYISGYDMIRDQNVEKAILQLGTAYRRGLGREQIIALKVLSSNGSFNPGDALSVELLVSRRILEYSATNFRVHPALIPLLPELIPL